MRTSKILQNTFSEMKGRLGGTRVDEHAHSTPIEHERVHQAACKFDDRAHTICTKIAVSLGSQTMPTTNVKDARIGGQLQKRGRLVETTDSAGEGMTGTKDWASAARHVLKIATRVASQLDGDAAQ